MTAAESFHEIVATALGDVAESLLTQRELFERIEAALAAPDAPITHFELTFVGPAPLVPLVLGARGAADPDYTNVRQGDENDGYSVRCALWDQPFVRSSDRDRAHRELEKLALAWWRPGGRSGKSHLLSGSVHTTQRAFSMTLARWLSVGRVAFCFADIDNFKAVNDQISMDAGDQKIAQLGALLHQKLRGDALLLHRSGDEFVIMFPSTVNPGLAAAHSASLREDIERILRDGVSTSPLPGLSMGLTLIAESVEYGQLETIATRVLKPNGSKRRGMLTIDESCCSFLDGSLRLAQALCNLGLDAPFDDPRLDGLSIRLSELLADIAWPDGIIGAMDVAVREVAPAESGLSDGERTAALVHGLGRSITLLQSGEGAIELKVYTGSETHQPIGVETMGVCSGERSSEALTIAIPTQCAPLNSHVGVLVEVGQPRLSLPSNLFASVIRVDDRSTLGGGLPDLWEPALARVIDAVAANPNVSLALLAGTGEGGALTRSWLAEIPEWRTSKNQELAERLDIPSSVVGTVASRLGDSAVGVADEHQAISQILERFVARPLVRAPEVSPVRQPPRSLKRALSLDGMLPTVEWGLGMRSAAEAYPAVLEVVRSSAPLASVDQTGRRYRELTDFRIQLEQPRESPVPRFYLSRESSLENYFNEQFVSPNGLFRKALDLHGQLDAVISHVAAVIDGQAAQTSRRALLVVPHIPEGADLSPLGLVSVRIAPRRLPGAVRLDFSYTWRTVEALVGLPYSLFGSIRFAEYLVERVTAAQVEGNANTDVSMGRLSYLAHSLHLFVDEYSERLARRIVNDDSM